MKLASYIHAGRPSWGVVVDGGIVDMARRFPELPSLRSALTATAQTRIAAAARGAKPDVALDAVTLLPPIPDPEKVICFGNNYREHVLEAGLKIPEYPSLFVRLANTLVGHGGAIVVPRVSSELDYETELALVIGRAGDMIKRIGTDARQDLERFFACKVFLDLRVKVKAGWRDDERVLDQMGLPQRRKTRIPHP